MDRSLLEEREEDGTRLVARSLLGGRHRSALTLAAVFADGGALSEGECQAALSTSTLSSRASARTRSRKS